jgi:hypothetical protein
MTDPENRQIWVCTRQTEMFFGCLGMHARELVNDLHWFEMLARQAQSVIVVGC